MSLQCETTETPASEVPVLVIMPDDAPPYTLCTLRFAVPSVATSAFLCAAQAMHAVNTLRELLTADLGVSVDASESMEFSTLRRDLAVTVERLKELQRSIGKPFQS